MSEKKVCKKPADDSVKPVVKHVYIHKKHHAELKRLANKENKKLMPYINEFLEWAIEYKNFLSKN